MGAVLADSRDGIPSNFLFRTGGDTTVRGYAFDSLGVPLGQAIVGGRYYTAGSVEVTRWIGAQPRCGEAAQLVLLQHDDGALFGAALSGGAELAARRQRSQSIGPRACNAAHATEATRLTMRFSA